MTTLTTFIPTDALTSGDAHTGRPKIIQRIPPARLSNWVKEDRMGDTDEALVLQSQRGDPAAFEALVRQYQQMIHALTFRMTGSPDDAEDLAQETFIRAYQQIGSFRSASKFSTWLYRIAVSVCLNWRQREARRLQVYANCAETLADGMAGTGTTEADAGLSQRVQAALLKLPAKQRAAIVLTAYDGMNHAEAAKVLGCTEATVSWRVFAARRKLQRWLATEAEQ